MAYVPPSEQDRAFRMMETVKAETGFGPGQAPFPFVREVARRLGGDWGLNAKRGNVNDPSSDILAFYLGDDVQPQLYDVLVDGGGRNELTWQPLRWPQSAGARWLNPNTLAPRGNDVPGTGTGSGGSGGSGGGGGGTRGSGRLPVLPTGLDPLAHKVMDIVASRMASLGSIPTGNEDGSTLEDWQTEGVKIAVTSIAGVAADWALRIARANAVPSKAEDELGDRLDGIFV